MIPGRGEKIETTINAEFWWDNTGFDRIADPSAVPQESFFGEAKIIPLPPIQSFNRRLALDDQLGQQVEAKFRIQVVSPSTQNQVQVEFIDVSIPANSTPPKVFNIPVGRDSVDVWLALSKTNNTFHNLGRTVGDPDRKQPRHYIVRAWGVSDGVADSAPTHHPKI